MAVYTRDRGNRGRRGFSFHLETLELRSLLSSHVGTNPHHGRQLRHGDPSPAAPFFPAPDAPLADAPAPSTPIDSGATAATIIAGRYVFYRGSAYAMGAAAGG